jgi:O-antigen/teichoic acid export membrane protein
MIGTANLVIATVAGGQGRQRFTLALRHACHGWAVVAPLLACVALFPAATLRLLYGSRTYYAQYSGLLWMMVVAYACEAVAMQAAAVIGGLGKTRSLFMMQGAGLVIALACGLPLAAYGGLSAALIGFVFVQMGRVAYGVRVWSTLWPHDEVQPGEGLQLAEGV